MRLKLLLLFNLNVEMWFGMKQALQIYLSHKKAMRLMVQKYQQTLINK